MTDTKEDLRQALIVSWIFIGVLAIWLIVVMTTGKCLI
jgi:hypothetical protein